jgi:peptidoglycan hydrolase-like amidase
MKRLYFAAACALLCLHPRAAATEVRIGVLGLFHSKQVVVIPMSGKPLECISGPSRWTLERPLRIVLQEPGAMRLSQPRHLLADPLRCGRAGGYAEFSVAVPGKLTRRYVGNLEVVTGSSEVHVIVTMALETAVASVVAAESFPGAPLEALKAQAVAARSFLIAGKGRHKDFDFCDTTHCQFLREPPALESPAYQAALQTRGLVLAYQDSAFPAMYSSSCGGKTHSLEELGLPVRGYPYYSVPCDYCRRHPQKWVTVIAQHDALSLSNTEPSRLNLARKLGWKAVPSNSYSSQREGDFVVLEGVGVGHGIGLCQRGAADMARHGNSFHQILAHYYPNTTLKQLP